VDLDEFRGQRVMVLFWSTSCYHCNILLPSLLEWEENRPPGAPRLVVAAAGPEDEIREFGFRSTVLLDPEYSASEIFGAYGVPLAALIDADGTYVTRIAGEEDILGVLRDEIPWPVAATPA
jgi:thiol-disulfide isomerase/thioredoxin